MPTGAVPGTRAEILRAWLRDRRRVVSALLVEIDGSAPLPAGAMMLIDQHGNVDGSITGGCVESAVVQEADAVLAGGPSRVFTYGISDELAGTVGLMCGGKVRVFVHELSGRSARAELMALEAADAGREAAIATLLDGPTAGAKLALVDDRLIGSLGGTELLDHNVARDMQGDLREGMTVLRRFGPHGETLSSELRVQVRSFAVSPRMLIFGAIDFSAALAPMAKQLGYAVTICDPRKSFVRAARFSAAADVVMAWPQRALEGLSLGPRDAVLVFTHDPKFDEPALIGALATGAGYIGALGSRATSAERQRRLRAAGVSQGQIARVHAPCGLDIGGTTAEETAVSVLAEIIAVRSARAGRPLRMSEGPIHAKETA
jgi:xanthine dehydrogenase accessory factor